MTDFNIIERVFHVMNVSFYSFMDSYEPMYRAAAAADDAESYLEDISDRLCNFGINFGLVPDDIIFIDHAITQYVEGNPALPLLIPVWGCHQLGALYKAGKAWEFVPSDRAEDEGIIISGSLESLRRIVGTYCGCHNPKNVEFVPYGAFGVFFSDSDGEDEFISISSTWDTADNEALSRNHFMTADEREMGCSYYPVAMMTM